MGDTTRRRSRVWELHEVNGYVMCCHCRRFLKFKQFTVEHLLPQSEGGRHVHTNLAPACSSCQKRPNEDLRGKVWLALHVKKLLMCECGRQPTPQGDQTLCPCVERKINGYRIGKLKDPEAWLRPLEHGRNINNWRKINMEQEEQLKFVDELTRSIAADCRKRIHAGDVPPAWDGFELRTWLADKFEEQVMSIMRDKRHKRSKDYRNTVIVNNL